MKNRNKAKRKSYVRTRTFKQPITDSTDRFTVDQDGPHKPGTAQRALPTLPAGVRRFGFQNEENIGLLIESSNSSATVIRYDGPALTLEITQAATYCQKLNAKGLVKANEQCVRAKFPVINYYCDDDRVLRIACSEPGKIEPKTEAVEAIVQRTQIPKGTVERYLRQPSDRRKFRKK